MSVRHHLQRPTDSVSTLWEASGMKLNWQWDWWDWSLSRITERWPDGKAQTTVTLFGLRCSSCKRFTFGCKDHWFCDLCESCRKRFENEKSDETEVPKSP